MKTLNKLYINREDLKEYIVENNIVQNQNILLQIFTSVCEIEFIETLVADIKELVPHINIVGTTTDGEIIDGNIQSYDTTLSFSFFDNTKIRVYSANKGISSFQTAKALISKIAEKEKAKVAIVFADGLETNGELFLEAFSKYTPHITVAGGLAGDNTHFIKTYVFTQDGITDAVSAILYNPNLVVNTSFNFGWEGIGREFVVTKADENRVYSIDNISPVALYKKYLGEEICSQLPATGIEFPLILQRGNRKIARAIVSREEDGSLIFAGNVNEGDRVQFGYGNIDHILHNTTSMFKNIVQTPVESIFVYSCMARKKLLGDDIKTEIAPLSQIAPVCGFFTYGEFFSFAHNEYLEDKLLNETMTILALSENDKKDNASYAIDSQNKEQTKTIEALHHLVAQVTAEYNDLRVDLEKRVQQEIQKNQKKDALLFSQAKTSQMGEMLSMIAHQWRQPLNTLSASAIALNLHLVLGQLEDEDVQRHIEVVEKNTQNMSAIINNFMNFFKPENKQTSFDLPNILNKINYIIGVSLINRNITLEVKGEDIVIYSYEKEFTHVLLNLLTNAKDAFDERKDIVDKKILISIETGDNKDTIIQVQDNAGGIKEENLERVFDAYFTTKEQGKGTGIGLYMTKRIVQEVLRGEIYVQNIGGGTCFTIILTKSAEEEI